MTLHTTSPKLYKKSSNGKVHVWFIELSADKNSGFLRTTRGQKDGKLHTTEWQHVKPTNVGKKNKRNTYEQAQFEMDAEIKEKLNQGRYTTDPTGVTDFPAPKPMLAKDYEKYKDKIWERGQIVCTQPKLDGIRCLSTRDGMFTRQGKDITSCPHILEELHELFKEFPSTEFVDGELYNHDLRDNFQKITSLVRKKNVTKESLEETKKLVQLHLYDRGSQQNFYNRWSNFVIRIHDLGLKHIKLVPTAAPADQVELDANYSEYLKQGYEGMMVRWGNVGYEEKRSSHLLKRKDFDTDEFEVKLVQEGEGDWQNAAKRFVCSSQNGLTFAAGVRGSYKDMAALWRSLSLSETTIDWATIRYFGLSNDGIPRFPVVIDYGSKERED